MLAYADDLVLLHHVDVNHPNVFQSDIDAVRCRASNLSLSFNFNKCMCVTFSRSPCSPPSVSLNGRIIPEVQTHIVSHNIILRSPTSFLNILAFINHSAFDSDDKFILICERIY